MTQFCGNLAWGECDKRVVSLASDQHSNNSNNNIKPDDSADAKQIGNRTSGQRPKANKREKQEQIHYSVSLQLVLPLNIDQGERRPSWIFATPVRLMIPDDAMASSFLSVCGSFFLVSPNVRLVQFWLK